jgi:hypothetical protein
MFIGCSRFLSLIFPLTVRISWTHTISSAAWKKMTHLVCGSCKRKLEHVQTCLGTWVCLAQLPSATMRTFLQFNWRTLYIEYTVTGSRVSPSAWRLGEKRNTLRRKEQDIMILLHDRVTTDGVCINQIYTEHECTFYCYRNTHTSVRSHVFTTIIW